MTDPLSILRQYNVNKQEIVEKDDHIILGEFVWPKSVKTNYLVFPENEGPKEYYTLESFLFLLKNIQLTHQIYMQQAQAQNIPHIRLPHRKDAIDFLSGQTSTSRFLDPNGKVEIPVPKEMEIKREPDDFDGDLDYATKAHLKEHDIKQEKEEDVKIHIQTADFYLNNILEERCVEKRTVSTSLEESIEEEMLAETDGMNDIKENLSIPTTPEESMKSEPEDIESISAAEDILEEAESTEFNTLTERSPAEPSPGNFSQGGGSINHGKKQKRIHTGERLFVCNECNHRATTRTGLVYHERTHTGDKPLSCSVCDFTCAQSSTLATHMRTHTGVKPYSCDFCEYKSRTKGTMTIHIRAHTGERPFACDSCDFKTLRSTILKKHTMFHCPANMMKRPLKPCQEKIKPIRYKVCVVCGFKCASSYYLKSHMMRHSDDRPFACEICVHRSRRASDLKVHMKTHTKEIKRFHQYSRLLMSMNCQASQ